MNILEYFESIDLQEINRYIADQQEENIHIEFKTVNHPHYNQSNREYDRNNLSKAISGFANSNGGIVIWGVKASPNNKGQDVAKELKPLQELTKFLNLLNRYEGQVVTPIVVGIKHKKIEIELDKGFIITYIPKSDNAPHMANLCEKHYFKRSGDSFYICEHYDILDMFNRRSIPKIEVLVLEKTLGGTGAGIKNYSKVIALKNTSKSIAKFPFLKIEVNPPFYMDKFGLDGNYNIGLFNSRAIPVNKHSATYLGGQDIVLHPGVIYEIDKVRYESPASDNSELPELIVKYFIAAEDMLGKSGELKVHIEPWT